MLALISYHEAPFSTGKSGLNSVFTHPPVTPETQPKNNIIHQLVGQDSPIVGGLAQLRGGSGGRPLCKATTAEPLHTA